MNKKSILQHKTSASLTIEAAMVLPIFLFGIIAFIYFLQIIKIQDTIQKAITDTGLYAAKYAYVYEFIQDYGEDSSDKGIKELDTKGHDDDTIDSNIEKQIARGIDSAFYKTKLLDYLDIKEINNSCIKNGYNGIHTYLSSYMEEDETVDIVLIYQMKIPLLFMELNEFEMVQRVKMRGWSGHKDTPKYGQIPEENDVEKMVFITETGTVYHLSKDCTHLRLSIRNVLFEQVEGLRNNSGGKYKECHICDQTSKPHKGVTVYITDTGDRYHWNIGCSGLKRTIREVPLSQVKDRAVCKRCGG